MARGCITHAATTTMIAAAIEDRVVNRSERFHYAIAL